MEYRQLMSVVVVLCLVCEIHAYRSLLFVKFHKVGGTTAAIVLSDIAREEGYTENCEGGANTACIEHASLSHMKNMCALHPESKDVAPCYESAFAVPLVSRSTIGHRHYDSVECDAPKSHSKEMLTRTANVLVRYRSLAETPLERVAVLFPSPLTIALLRHPVEKLISRIYFNCALGNIPCDDDNVARLLPSMWKKAAEYGPVLGCDKDGNVDLRLAIRTLEGFEVVGVNESIAALFAQVAFHLKRPISDFKFRSAKVVDGRPTYEELADNIKRLMNQLIVKNEFLEVQIYRTAEKIAAERVSKFRLEENIIKLDEMSAALNVGDCDTAHHSSAGAAKLIGSWCYEMKVPE